MQPNDGEVDLTVIPGAVRRRYVMTETTERFHDDESFIRALMGPLGSGKSTAAVMEIMMRAGRQKPGPDGKRRSRWVVVRNTYRELADTTVKTFHDWVPPTPGRPRRWRVNDMTYEVEQDDVHLEVLFRALDRPDDIKKLLSLEVTGAWLNEVREIPLAVLNMLEGRVGRYPPAREEGCTWFGVIMDTNPPDNDHWFYKWFEEKRPAGWRLFRQPSGLVPSAENVGNLPKGYYDRLAQGKTDEWVKVYVKGDYGFVIEGKVVYPEYNDRIHCAAEPLPVVKELPIYLGWDFGLTPSCVLGQRLPTGRWIIPREWVFDGLGVDKAAEIVARDLNQDYGDEIEITGWGDPAGTAKAQTDEKTCFQILGARGFDINPGPSQDLTLRRESVVAPMGKLVDGHPGFLISPTCRVLRKGFQGGYAYKRMQVTGAERYQDKPDKNLYSHPHDALQYLMSGAGEGDSLRKRKDRETDSMPKWLQDYIEEEAAASDDWMAH